MPDSPGSGGARRRHPRAHADPLLLLLDLLAVLTAYALALLLRFDGVTPAQAWRGYALFVPVAVVAHVVSNARRQLYGQVWAQASIQDARRLVTATRDAGLLLFLLGFIYPGRELLPLSIPLLGTTLALLLLGVARFHGRLFRRRAPAPPSAGSTRVVLIGSIEIVRGIVQEMLADPGRGLVPVAVITEHPRYWGRWIAGVPVAGPLAVLPAAARLHGAEQALLAFEERDAVMAQRAVDRAQQADLRVKVVPTVSEILGSRPSLGDIRELSIEDLLGRPQVETDMAAIAKLLAGRRVLITGAGGSIGAEIAAQVQSFGPARLLLLERDETHLHDVVLGLGPATVPVLGDIRDVTFLEELFACERPEVVFHAAAHKHVPILEQFPAEAVLTNVLGTDNLLRAAAAHGVQRFVAISTDKAVDPSSVMGASKRLGEQLLLQHRPEAARYCAVRFGNVLGSRGSVVPTFVRQIEQGGPVTVTHPDMRRYFMSAREAVQLVLQAAVLTQGGEIFVLDMGEPVPIVELARRLILLAGATPGRDVDIEFVGVRPGEKLTETLVGGTEMLQPTRHPQIGRVSSPAVGAEHLRAGVDRLARYAQNHDGPACAAGLRALASNGALPVTVELRA